MMSVDFRVEVVVIGCGYFISDAAKLPKAGASLPPSGHAEGNCYSTRGKEDPRGHDLSCPYIEKIMGAFDTN